jgi:hypothetical protein
MQQIQFHSISKSSVCENSCVTQFSRTYREPQQTNVAGRTSGKANAAISDTTLKPSCLQTTCRQGMLSAVTVLLHSCKQTRCMLRTCYVMLQPEQHEQNANHTMVSGMCCSFTSGLLVLVMSHFICSGHLSVGRTLTCLKATKQLVVVDQPIH